VAAVPTLLYVLVGLWPMLGAGPRPAGLAPVVAHTNLGPGSCVLPCWNASRPGKLWPAALVEDFSDLDSIEEPGGDHLGWSVLAAGAGVAGARVCWHPPSALFGRGLDSFPASLFVALCRWRC
jgi:hypothetical protein